MDGGFRFADSGSDCTVCHLCRPPSERLNLFSGFGLLGRKKEIEKKKALELFIDLCYDAHDTRMYAVAAETAKTVKGR